MSDQTKSPTKVVTGKVRLSYANLTSPKADDKGDMKYSTAALIPKSDKATLQKVKAAVEAVKKDPAAVEKWGGKVPGEMKLPLRDGDLKADEHPEYAGHYYFNCSSKQKPGIVDKDLNPIMDASEIYSGMYARVAVNFFAFSSKGNKGIGVGLNNVQKLADGEPLSGRSKPEDDFSDDLPEDDFLS
ncbi:MAG: hypothetical protein H6Q73_889 [Firmicutes bacterium]|nr:hypothetical protein [Bacillota bacterium]